MLPIAGVDAVVFARGMVLAHLARNVHQDPTCNTRGGHNVMAD